MLNLLAIGFLIAAPASDLWNAPEPLSLDAHSLPAPESRPGGVWLPAPLDAWVRDRLAAYAVYPERCQVRLSSAKQVTEARIDSALKTAALLHEQDKAELRAEAASNYAWWEVALIAGVAAVGGVGVGAIAWSAAR